jgi:hypothetical protein
VTKTALLILHTSHCCGSARYHRWAREPLQAVSRRDESPWQQHQQHQQQQEEQEEPPCLGEGPSHAAAYSGKHSLQQQTREQDGGISLGSSSSSSSSRGSAGLVVWGHLQAVKPQLPGLKHTSQPQRNIGQPWACFRVLLQAPAQVAW